MHRQEWNNREIYSHLRGRGLGKSCCPAISMQYICSHMYIVRSCLLTIGQKKKKENKRQKKKARTSKCRKLWGSLEYILWTWCIRPRLIIIRTKYFVFVNYRELRNLCFDTQHTIYMYILYTSSSSLLLVVGSRLLSLCDIPTSERV